MVRLRQSSISSESDSGLSPGLLLGLRRVDVPVLDVIKLDLVADVVLDGELVDVAGRFRVRYQKAGLREGIGRPDVGEGAAASVRDPQAGILAVPALAQVGVGGVVVVVGIASPLPWPPRKRTSSMSDCSPAFQSTATARGLMPPVKTPMPLRMFVAAGRRKNHGLRRADALKPGVSSSRSICVSVGCRPMSTVSGLSASVSRTT